MVVPDVVTSLCGERVLVSEYVEGARFSTMLEAPQAERDRAAEILLRFYPTARCATACSTATRIRQRAVPR